MLDATDVRASIPQDVGPEVLGASYSPMDGHVNPLKLLRALHAAHAGARRAIWCRTSRAHRIAAAGARLRRHGSRGTYRAARLVLAAGLGNRALAPFVGLDAPVAPNRGQVLVSERVAPFLHYPTLNVRQTDEGSVQFGDSMEEVGFNDFTTTPRADRIARRGVRAFPMLKNVRLVRMWAALRVYSPDGFPIYDQSAAHPGAFVVTCHSGVTLAAAHALRIAPWIMGAPMPDELPPFPRVASNTPRTDSRSLNRYDAQPNVPRRICTSRMPPYAGRYADSHAVQAAAQRARRDRRACRNLVQRSALSVPGGRSVAAALLAAGVARFRATPVSGAPRAPFCMMGACFECLVEIDGVPSRQSCMVEVKAGMRIRSQEGARDLPPFETASPLDASMENAHGR